LKLADVKPYVSGLLAASVPLQAFGEPVIFSWMSDDETLRADANEQIDSTGAYLEVWMLKPERTNPLTDRGLIVEAPVVIFVAESKKKAHTPSEDALVDAVIAALMASNQPFVRFTNCESEMTEHGYVLHTVLFHIRFPYA
jgi:hypothetical protein